MAERNVRSIDVYKQLTSRNRFKLVPSHKTTSQLPQLSNISRMPSVEPVITSRSQVKHLSLKLIRPQEVNFRVIRPAQSLSHEPWSSYDEEPVILAKEMTLKNQLFPKGKLLQSKLSLFKKAKSPIYFSATSDIPKKSPRLIPSTHR